MGAEWSRSRSSRPCARLRAGGGSPRNPAQSGCSPCLFQGVQQPLDIIAVVIQGGLRCGEHQLGEAPGSKRPGGSLSSSAPMGLATWAEPPAKALSAALSMADSTGISTTTSPVMLDLAGQAHPFVAVLLAQLFTYAAFNLAFCDCYAAFTADPQPPQEALMCTPQTSAVSKRLSPTSASATFPSGSKRTFGMVIDS
jgi:hypothetical protein